MNYKRKRGAKQWLSKKAAGTGHLAAGKMFWRQLRLTAGEDCSHKKLDWQWGRFCAAADSGGSTVTHNNRRRQDCRRTVDVCGIPAGSCQQRYRAASISTRGGSRLMFPTVKSVAEKLSSHEDFNTKGEIKTAFLA